MGILNKIKEQAKAQGIAEYYKVFGKYSTVKEYGQEAFDAAFGSKAEESVVVAEESVPAVEKPVVADEPAVTEEVPVAADSTTLDDDGQGDSPEMPVDEAQTMGDLEADNPDL